MEEEEARLGTECLFEFITEGNNIPKGHLDKFQTELTDIMACKFREHGYLISARGNHKFRYFDINQNYLYHLAEQLGIAPEDLKIPYRIKIFVNPTEVICKFEDRNDSISIIGFFKNRIGSYNRDVSCGDFWDSQSGVIRKIRLPAGRCRRLWYCTGDPLNFQDPYYWLNTWLDKYEAIIHYYLLAPPSTRHLRC